LATWWTCASLTASYYIYDRSGMYAWGWLKEYIAPPRRYVNIHAGLDESSDKLRHLFPAARGRTLNIFDPSRMGESSIHRAQQTGDTPVDALALPLDDASVDTAFVLMAAHELRDPADRRGFFGELRRIIEPNGQIIVVEHLRDIANFCAFGPGFTHFLSRRAWRTAARDVGLTIDIERSATPFVAMFRLRRSP
jgi:SAM-dependent methyltransferase